MFFSQVPVDTSQISGIVSTLQTQLTGLALKLGGAILLWLVASWLIRKSTGLLSRLLQRQQIDATLIRYLVNFIGVMLNVVLVVAILGYFGIETTSFAALLAAAGIAIGAAWSGLLANFAAGVFLILFRPFAVGDFIEAGGVIGTVKEIGLFVTAIDTMDNVRTIVGNNTIFAGNIQNFSANPYRRVDLVAQLNHSVAPDQAIALLQENLAKIPNIMQDPAPDVEILEFNLAGPVLAVRPYCNNDHYWQVYFDTNKVIRESFGEAGYPTPENHYALRQVS
ncbi:mechanosensitive ion channel family protein [[Limnothrix rosea] IAM M-220]|uniref:mechanosensitive ion channel family protein n=1 Tax=[Limnothrix rosea] IAM M-220 TaxID=454133 RepID=UPI000963AAA0|nr:mechanosensitive ion channel family protein [[Limnothrix rosea] IAM M-220]OKH17085.1 mechanosensitive ion channel protein MscS [[Limnothrix rosea] IAM M-220]